MKNVYIMTCYSIYDDGEKFATYTTTFTNKVKANNAYKTYSRKRYVQEIILGNTTTGEVIHHMYTGNVVCGHRMHKPLIIK